MMQFRLNPITRKRLQRFRRIRRGFYSFVILASLTLLSLFSNYLANRRAIVVSYEGSLYFPTFQYHDMATFGQQDEYGFDDVKLIEKTKARYGRIHTRRILKKYTRRIMEKYGMIAGGVALFLGILIVAFKKKWIEFRWK